MMLNMNKQQIQRLIKEHLEEVEPGCRWCFAVDMQTVKGNVVATYNYPDATLVHLSCPRCNGEFTLYIKAWDESYIKDIIFKMHPELKARIDDKLFAQINDRVFPEYFEI